jgi:hypothetical protein
LENQTDDDIGNAPAEVSMSAQSFPELETRLELTFKKIATIDIEIGKQEVASQEAAVLRQLWLANSNLALALIHGMDRAAPCNFGQIQKELHEAEIELAAAERGMGTLDGGSMTQRWDRFEAAKTRFWNAFDASCEHSSTCPTCRAKRSR